MMNLERDTFISTMHLNALYKLFVQCSINLLLKYIDLQYIGLSRINTPSPMLAGESLQLEVGKFQARF